MKAALLLLFLASSVFAQNSPPVPAAQRACGPFDAKFRIKTDESQPPEPKVEAGKTLIYVVEEQRFKAIRDVTVRIGLDGTWMGATRGNSYLFFSAEPGEHHLCVDWASDFYGRLVSLYGLTTEPGKVYYFRARTTGGRSSAAGRDFGDDAASIDLDLINP